MSDDLLDPLEDIIGISAEAPARKVGASRRKKEKEVVEETSEVTTEPISYPKQLERNYVNFPSYGQASLSEFGEGVVFKSYAKEHIVFLGQQESPYTSERNPFVQFSRRTYITDDLNTINSLRNPANGLGHTYWEGELPPDVIAKIKEDEKYLTYVKSEHEALDE